MSRVSKAKEAPGHQSVRGTSRRARDTAASRLTKASEDLRRAMNRYEEATRLIVDRVSGVVASEPQINDDEDALAVSAFDRAMAERAEAPVSIDVVRRLAEGESAIKVWREHRGLTQAALAERSGLRQGSISDLERGRRGTASFDTMCRIADALHISLDDLRPPAD